MRKLLIISCVLLMCGSVAYAGKYVPRYVNIGNAGTYAPFTSGLAYAYAVTNDSHVGGSHAGALANGPVVAVRGFGPDGSGTETQAWQGGTFNQISPAGVDSSTPYQGGRITADGLKIGMSRGYLGVATSVTAWGSATTTRLSNVGAATPSDGYWDAPRMTADGSKAACSLNDGTAATWTGGPPPGTGTVLSGLATVVDMSPNGRFILGTNTSGNPAVLDTNDSSVNALPNPSGDTIRGSFAVADTGRVVGASNGGGNSNLRRTIIWNYVSGSYGTPTAYGTSRNEGGTISADGSIVSVRKYETYKGMLENHFYVLYPDTGTMTHLETLLSAAGVTVPAGDVILSTDGSGISPDGLTFCGETYYTGSSEKDGFFATLPEPASLMLLVLGLPFLRRRR